MLDDPRAWDYMILIISLAISIQTMIVAPTGKTTKPNDASMSSICFILFSFLAKCIEVLALGWASQSIHLLKQSKTIVTAYHIDLILYASSGRFFVKL